MAFSRIEIWDIRFTSIFSVFSVMGDMEYAFHEYTLRIFGNAWMDCRGAFHTVLCLYCCVTDRT